MVGLMTLGSGGSFITVFAGLWSPGRDGFHSIILRRLLTDFFRVVAIFKFILIIKDGVSTCRKIDRFDWSAFHRFGFVVDGALSRLFAGTGGRRWFRVSTRVL
ncbi:hypothetical protein HID58_064782 [Brassica napus]|uniref:Uncharacterized protein n=1 Tax=Brassica napus TaxID=3708 RepID=A0ABQ7ZBD3_BRANA|nr:hypothetical protein HID58_064782 [Brassica napus]